MDKERQRTYEYELMHRDNNNNSKQNTMEEGTKLKQYIAACAVNLATFSAGISLGWTSPSLPKLKGDEGNPLDTPLTEDQASWTGSLIALGAVFGPICAGLLVDRIGRKVTLLTCAAPMIIGWILMATTFTVAQIYVARFLWGIGVGMVFTVAPNYVAEIADSDIRGALGSFMQLFITFGLLYSYVIGPYVSFLVLCILSVILPILFIVSFIFMPESPYFLLSKQHNTSAEKSLMFLRGKSKAGVQKELEEMQANVEETMEQKGGFKDLIATVGSKKALIISLGLVTFQQLGGINVVLFYTETIFDATGSTMSPSLSTIIIGIVQVVASGVTPLVVDRLGRRILLFISGAGMALALAILGLFFFLKNNGHDVSGISFLPVVCLVGYMSVYCVGLGPLPWSIMGEIFPANTKSIASTVTASFCWFLGFIITKYFSAVSESLGMDVAFWIFAVCCVLSVIFVFFLVPETKGKSLQEILDVLEGR